MYARNSFAVSGRGVLLSLPPSVSKLMVPSTAYLLDVHRGRLTPTHVPLRRDRSLPCQRLARQRIAGRREGQAALVVVAHKFLRPMGSSFTRLDLFRKHVCWRCRSTDPLNVVGMELLQPLPAVLPDDQGEEISNGIVVVWDCRDDPAFPLRIHQLEIVVRDVSFGEFRLVV